MLTNLRITTGAHGCLKSPIIKISHNSIALLKDNIRYSHILNPMTGWPVPDAPHSVTVVADTCMEAGVLSTFAMLKGKQAAEFLKAQQVPFWIC